MDQFISFSSVKETIYGGKANNLARLFQNKYNVPDGFIIPTSAIEAIINSQKNILNNSIEDEKKAILNNNEIFNPLIDAAWINIKKIKQKGPISVAVRSSGNFEDGINLSFAGQFTSVLNVSDYDSFKNAFMQCLLSKYNDSVIAYCKANGIEHSDIKMNIIVQQMVNADYSGVCFTINPMTGNEKEMLFETIAGLGENLVQGKISPNSYRYNWYDDNLEIIQENNKNKVSENLLKELINISLSIQQNYGEPQDIEWSIKNNQIYILQTRPLTSIKFDTKYDWTTADLKDGGISSEITTPFMYSLYEYSFEKTMPEFFKTVKIYPDYEPDKWFTHFMLYSYWNLSSAKDGVKKIPGYIEREFDNDLGVEAIYEGNGYITKTNLKSIISGIKVLLALKKYISKLLANAENKLTTLDNIIKKNNQINWQELNSDEFIEKANNLVINDYFLTESTYFFTIYTNSNNTTLFKGLLLKHNKNGNINYLNLISGLQKLSHLKPSFELWKISRGIHKNSEFKNYYITHSVEDIYKDYFEKQNIPFYSEIKEFINKYGYHSEKELNILTPNWDENPSQVFSTLKNFVNKDETQNIIEQNKKQEEFYIQEIEKIKSKKLLKAIKQHRYLLWLREEFRDRSTQMYHLIRKVFLIAGQKLTEEKILTKPEEIFFLTFNEALQLFNGKTSLIEKINKNKIYYNSFINFKRPNEIWGNKEIKNIKKFNVNNNNILTGIACSNGTIEGEVYVAKTIKDAELMPNGKIMLTHFTDPAWTVYFSKINGLITETGGVLSHGAIVSREYGIPAVLGVKSATEILKTGMKIILNGNEGRIQILKN